MYTVFYSHPTESGFRTSGWEMALTVTDNLTDAVLTANQEALAHPGHPISVYFPENQKIPDITILVAR